jgi:hypothetical protein
VCGRGPEQGFSIFLQPEQRIRVGQVSNDFTSAYTLRYGGFYPGESEVTCVNSYNDTLIETTYMNDGTAPVKVYFVVDVYYSSTTEGNFELEWIIDTPGTTQPLML